MTLEPVSNWTMSEDNGSCCSNIISLAGNQTILGQPKECELPVNDGFLEFFVYGIMLNVVSILGIIGNTISIIILSRPQMKSSINYLLIGLASCDTILILLSVSEIPSYLDARAREF